MTPSQLADQIEQGTVGPDGLALIRSERRLIVEALRAFTPSHALGKCGYCGKPYSEPSAAPDACRDDHSAPSTTPRKAVPYEDILEQIAHVERNGIDLKKFGGDNVSEGRCRELAALFLREWITSEEMRLRLVELDAALSATARSGWAIQHVDGRWRTIDTIGMPDFTDDAAKALVCRLREHVVAYAADDPEDVRIVEVPW